MPKTKTKKTGSTRKSTAAKRTATKAKTTARTGTARTLGAKKSKSAAKSKAKSSITVDRRAAAKPDRRKQADRRKKDVPIATQRRKIERRAKVNRRRQIDPTTCERDYTPEELEFMIAMDDYKRASGRMFPTCSEVLEVLKKLGYQRCSEAEAAGPSVEEAEGTAEAVSADNPAESAETPALVEASASGYDGELPCPGHCALP